MASLWARLVGGLQWAITGSYLYLLGFLLVAWYLQFAGTWVSLDGSWPLVAVLAASFVAGYVWVGSRSDDSDAHARRIEVIVTLLVLGFLLPFGIPRLLDAFGVVRPLPLFGFGVAYALALALSYGLVYGLGVRFFLGHDPALPGIEE